jgi:RimJ/RimL family protein N-acetyltransferase
MRSDTGIRPLGHEDVLLFNEHFSRHRSESGRGDWHFMPFAPDDAPGPAGMDPRRLNVPLDAPGWQRWFGAFADGGARIVGHVDVKGETLATARHRCELGIGIERSHRGQGLGRRLMETAIRFAREADSIAWLDLKVFAHNAPARALYRSLGFIEIGTVRDRFRIEGTRIDDVIMTLDVSA